VTPQRQHLTEAVTELPSQRQGGTVILPSPTDLVNLAQPTQCQDLTEAVTNLSAKDQGLGEVLASLATIADEPRYLTQTP
jgi:hypothetical protein